MHVQCPDEGVDGAHFHLFDTAGSIGVDVMIVGRNAPCYIR